MLLIAVSVLFPCCSCLLLAGGGTSRAKNAKQSAGETGDEVQYNGWEKEGTRKRTAGLRNGYVCPLGCVITEE